jgi:hypothetical protein
VSDEESEGSQVRDLQGHITKVSVCLERTQALT